MKEFKKLALISAIAALPAAGFAMEALDDATMSGVTGQDGISIGLGLNATLNVGIEDIDGFTAAGTAAIVGTGTATTPQFPAVPGIAFTDSGMLLIRGMGIAGGVTAGGSLDGTDATVGVTIDSGTRGAGSALNVGISIGNIALATGDIFVGAGQDNTVAATHTAGLAALAAVDTTGTPLLSSSTITMAGADIGIQLGAGASDFLSLSGSIAGGLRIQNMRVNDVVGTGGLLVEDMYVLGSATNGDLQLDGTRGSITTSGLVLTLGNGLDGLRIAQMGVKLGDVGNAVLPPSIGNVYITGLNLGGNTITVSGH